MLYCHRLPRQAPGKSEVIKNVVHGVQIAEVDNAAILVSDGVGCHCEPIDPPRSGEYDPSARKGSLCRLTIMT
jgi:hypothetical protein